MSLLGFSLFKDNIIYYNVVTGHMKIIFIQYAYNMPVDREILCLATKSSNCIFTVFTVNTNWDSTT